MDTTQCSLPRLDPARLHLESSALTMRPLCPKALALFRAQSLHVQLQLDKINFTVYFLLLDSGNRLLLRRYPDALSEIYSVYCSTSSSPHMLHILAIIIIISVQYIIRSLLDENCYEAQHT